MPPTVIASAARNDVGKNGRLYPNKGVRCNNRARSYGSAWIRGTREPRLHWQLGEDLQWTACDTPGMQRMQRWRPSLDSHQQAADDPSRKAACCLFRQLLERHSVEASGPTPIWSESTFGQRRRAVDCQTE